MPTHLVERSLLLDLVRVKIRVRVRVRVGVGVRVRVRVGVGVRVSRPPRGPPCPAPPRPGRRRA